MARGQLSVHAGDVDDSAVDSRPGTVVDQSRFLRRTAAQTRRWGAHMSRQAYGAAVLFNLNTTANSAHHAGRECDIPPSPTTAKHTRRPHKCSLFARIVSQSPAKAAVCGWTQRPRTARARWSAHTPTSLADEAEPGLARHLDRVPAEPAPHGQTPLRTRCLGRRRRRRAA